MTFASAGLGLLFLAAASGWGWAVATRFGRHGAQPERDRWGRPPLAPGQAPGEPRHEAPRNPDRLLVYPLLGLILFAFLGSILWLTGGFVSQLAWVLIGVGCILAFWGAREDGESAWNDFRDGTPTPRVRLLVWGAAILLAIPVLLAPDTSWDSGSLHLVISWEAAAHGRLPLEVDHPHLFNMFTAHTLLGWGYLIDGLERSTSGRLLLTALAGLALAIATRRVGRHFNPQLGLMTLVLVLTTPIWITQWGTAMVDLVVFATTSCGLALCLLREKDPDSPKNRWLSPELLVGMSCLAFAAGTKHWGVVVAVSLAAVWGAQSLRTRSAVPLASATLLGLLCIGAATPWFLKNEVALGNPLAVDIRGENAQALATHKMFGEGLPAPPDFYGAPPERSLEYPLAVIARISSGFPWASALSPLLFCWLPFALLGRRTTKWWVAWCGAAVTLTFYVVAVPSLESYSPARYFFNVAPWAYFLAAVGWRRWVGNNATRARLAWTLLIVTALPTLGLGSIRSLRKLPVVVGRQTEVAYWQSRDPAAPILDTLSRRLAPSERIFFVGERVNLLRVPRKNLIRTYQAHRAGVSSAKQLSEAWDQWGVTHVVVNDGAGERWDWGVQRDWVTGDRPALTGWRLTQETAGAQLYERIQPESASLEKSSVPTGKVGASTVAGPNDTPGTPKSKALGS